LHSVTTDGWCDRHFNCDGDYQLGGDGLEAMVIGKVKKATRRFTRLQQVGSDETAKLDQAESEEDAEIESSQLLIALYGKHDHYQDSTLYAFITPGCRNQKSFRQC